MTTELERQLATLRPGDHICPIYASVEERLAVAIPFLREGLAREEGCLYVADQQSVALVLKKLAEAGVDVAKEQARGALRTLTEFESSCKEDGKFNGQVMMERLRQEQEHALAAGFAGSRVLGEMVCVLSGLGTTEELIAFEALLNKFQEDRRAVVVCQYDRRRFDPVVIHDILRTHPVAILGDQVCPNPYYEPPELVLSGRAPESAALKARRVEWWIEQLGRARTMEQERQRSLEKLQQSERRLAEAQRVAHIGSWERDLLTGEVTWSEELYRLFGRPAQKGGVSYEQFLGLVAPQDVERIRRLVDQAIHEGHDFACDYQNIRPDGSVRLLHDQGHVVLNEAGEAVRLVGTAQDVTELRQAEAELHEYAARLQALMQRLLEVQETERRHLARELHDEIGQLLTGLRLVLKANHDASAEAVRTKFDEGRQLVDELLEKVRGLSFDLRPAALDQLGLLPALLALFERYSKRTSVLVDFKHSGLEKRFSAAVETAVYRIVQEGLTNVARHAGVAGVTVHVWAKPEALSLRIQDQGRGFDPTNALPATRSSGIAGMQERAMMLGGRLTIESCPGTGTELSAEIPLNLASMVPP